MAKQFLEKNLEEIIFETSNERLQDRGLEITGKKKRQVKIGNYGVSDILTFEKDSEVLDGTVYHCLIINVFELKKEKIDATALMQAYRYKKGIERYLKHRGFSQRVFVRAVLIGQSICEGDFCYMQEYIDSLSIYTYEYDFDGISFSKVSSYSLIREGWE